MNIKQCKTIYDAAVAKKACTGNIEAAKRYLDLVDTEGFERVCRGNLGWLKYNKISYKLTDGVGEDWHRNGVLYKRKTYINGKIEGVYESWHDNGILSLRCNYTDGKTDGLYTVWNENGIMSKRFIYVSGVRHGLYEEWDRHGHPIKVHTYINGVIQD